jgi:hypothetical protein
MSGPGVPSGSPRAGLDFTFVFFGSGVAHSKSAPGSMVDFDQAEPAVRCANGHSGVLFFSKLKTTTPSPFLQITSTINGNESHLHLAPFRSIVKYEMNI